MPCDYAIFLDMTDRLAVVIGGGAVATRKIEKLLAAGARVRVIGPEICDEIKSLTRSATQEPKPEIELVHEPFRPDHVAGATLVFACTNSPEVNRQTAEAARAAGVPVNSADDPANCDFFMPAVSEHGPVKIAISTGGAAPALARFIREMLDDALPAELPMLASELARLRPEVHRRVASGDDRAAIWRQLCSVESIRRLQDGGLAAWREWAESLLDS